jgi:hypothetical protein
MTLNVDGYLLEFPGVTQRFAWPAAEELEGAPARDLVVSAIAALAPLVRPLTVDVLLRAYDRETHDDVALAHPFWFAATTGDEVGARVAPSTSGAVCRHVAMLTPTAIGALIDEARAGETLSEDVAWTWDQLWIYAAEIRVPSALADRDILSLGVPYGDVGAPIERNDAGAWFNSLRSPGDEPPMVVTMTGGYPRLNIITHWSLWSPGGAGEPDLNAATARLMALGWIRCA